MKTEKQPIGTEALWSAYDGRPMRAKLRLPGGGALEFCLPCCFGSDWEPHSCRSPAPFLGCWPGSRGEAGNCGKRRRRSWGASLKTSGKGRRAENWLPVLVLHANNNQRFGFSTRVLHISIFSPQNPQLPMVSRSEGTMSVRTFRTRDPIFTLKAFTGFTSNTGRPFRSWEVLILELEFLDMC